jgi:DNA-binding response OmpR family regulator
MNRMQPGPILAVDRNPRNLQLLTEVLDSTGFSALPVPDLAQLDEALAQASPIGLALVDVDGFDPAIWERCRQLHDRHVEVLVLVGQRAIPLARVQSARCGARAVLPKPLSPKLLAELVRGLMEAPE